MGEIKITKPNNKLKISIVAPKNCPISLCVVAVSRDVLDARVFICSLNWMCGFACVRFIDYDYTG